MGIFAAGQVVIVHFPFSDLTASKLRPAVVLAKAGRGDWILCQITSKSYGDGKAISLEATDFAHGSLRQWQQPDVSLRRSAPLHRRERP